MDSIVAVSKVKVWVVQAVYLKGQPKQVREKGGMSLKDALHQDYHHGHLQLNPTGELGEYEECISKSSQTSG